MNRDVLARVALSHIPKILTLLDRNPHSPTYGCFDRNFWHYKIIDFPSGMAQEFVWPLALAYDTPIDGNVCYKSQAVRNWVEAGIEFAVKSAHRNGSCDDYFPFEQAAGAAAFSLLACIESYELMHLNRPDLLQFLAKRGDWLARHEESGRLTNHVALTLLGLERLSAVTGTSRWDAKKSRLQERILAWQDNEGWFQEYDGFDPGYHTLTISCLASLYSLRGDDALKNAIVRAVNLVRDFVHPDGSFGGEYASRNTYNFFPHGFELAGRWMPEALSVNDRFLKGLESGMAPCYADDHILGHHAWNYLLAWRDYIADRPPVPPRATGRIWLKNAGILVDRRNGTELYAALNKGGVFKLFRNDRLIVSDTQFSVVTRHGRKTGNAVGHLIDNYRMKLDENRISVAGELGWSKNKAMTPFRIIALRLIMLAGGRLFPNLVRKLLQAVLITGKKNAPFSFERKFEWAGNTLTIHDELRTSDWRNVRRIGIGCDQTSTYTVMSRTFQKSQLIPWLDLTNLLDKAGRNGTITLDREF